jgi:hypothetical protein
MTLMNDGWVGFSVGHDEELRKCRKSACETRNGSGRQQRSERLADDLGVLERDRKTNALVMRDSLVELAQVKLGHMTAASHGASEPERQFACSRRLLRRRDLREVPSP